MKRIFQSHLALSSQLKFNMPILELIELNGCNKVSIIDLIFANHKLYAARPDKFL